MGPNVVLSSLCNLIYMLYSGERSGHQGHHKRIKLHEGPNHYLSLKPLYSLGLNAYLFENFN